MKYSDEEIRTLLRKLRDKKRRYIRNEEKHNNVLLEEMQTAFDKSSLFDETTGRIITLEEFKTKFAGAINYKMEIVKDMLRRNYISEMVKTYKKSVEEMARRQGLDDIAEDIKQMTMRDFVKKYRAGEFEKIQDDYEDKKEEARAKEVSLKKGGELTYEEKRILGYITKETS